MRRQVLIAFSLIGLCIAPAAAHDRREILAQQKQQALDAIKAKPLLEQKQIEDVFEIGRDGDDLVLRTLIPPLRYYEDRRAELAGLPFPAVILCREESHDLNQVEFEFTLDDWSDPLVHGQLHILSRPSELHIEKQWNTPSGQHGVLFAQMDGVVTLSLRSDEGKEGMPVMNVAEPSFAVFARKHWELLQTYVGPILREVHQDAALAPEPAAAWQILADDWPLDPSLRQTVLSQVPELGADDFRARARAAQALQKIGKPAALYLLHLDRQKLSPEQREQVDAVISRFNVFPNDVAGRLHDDPQFLADCLYVEDPGTCKLALARLGKITGQTINFDVHLSGAERGKAVRELREKVLAKTEK